MRRDASAPVVASIGDRLLSVGLAGWAFVSVYATRRKRPRSGSEGVDERSTIQFSSAAVLTARSHSPLQALQTGIETGTPSPHSST